MTAALISLGIIGALAGYVLGAWFPPCCPGEQRSCYTAVGYQGVSYCRRSGFGWERCRELGQPYPQALWRSE
jgi:hypothetical protein